MLLTSTLSVAAVLFGKCTCIRIVIGRQQFCGLPCADRQRNTDKFESLGIQKCPYEIPTKLSQLAGWWLSCPHKKASTTWP